jgi:NADPH-dependent curcumin reductase CurA
MNQPTNRRWVFVKRPKKGDRLTRDFFRWEEGAIPEPGPNEMLVRTTCLGTSPAQFGYLLESGRMHAPMELGEVMRSRGVGEVIASNHPAYKAGDFVTASLGWQDYSLQDPTREPPNIKTIYKVETPVRPLTTALGMLGVDGFAAYFGLLDIGRPRDGQTVLVSAAGGGIGSVVGQIAKIKGCRAVGIAGTREKCRWITEDLGFDAAINYRDENVADRLDALCPNGIDVFFDCVGGAILNEALLHLAMKARIIVCGYISTDYMPPPVLGPNNYTKLLVKRARMEGFVVFDYASRFAEAEADLRAWYLAGKLKNTEDLTEGLENAPDALASLFSGANKGIKIIRVAPDPERLPALGVPHS